MSGPWEKYQSSAQEGPWMKYQTASDDTETKSQSSASDLGYVINLSMDSIKNTPMGIINSANDLISKGANKFGQFSAERLAGQGMNPYVSAGIGTAVSMAPDIVQAASMPNLSESEASQLINNKGSRFIGEQASKIGKQLSGNSPEDIQALFKSPQKFFSPSLDKAKALYGEAISSEGPSIAADEKTAFDAATKTAKNILSKLKTAPDTVDPLEALEGRKALDEVIRSTKSGRKLAKLYELRQPLDAVVKSSPELAKADEVYAASKLASRFRNFMPVTAKGDPAFFKTGIASFLSGTLHNPLPSIAVSPLTIGGITAAAGGLNNLSTGMLRGLPRYAPLLQALFNKSSENQSSK